MMDSANLPFAQSTSKVDNRFNRWSAPLFKVALCPLPVTEPSSCPDPMDLLDLNLDQTDSTRGFAFLRADDRQNWQKENVIIDIQDLINEKMQ